MMSSHKHVAAGEPVRHEKRAAFYSMFRSKTRGHGLVLLMLVGTPMGWAGEKIEPPFERAALTEVSNAGRPMEHWFVLQTECCNYTIRNWRLFSGLTIGGVNEVQIRDQTAIIRVGKKTAKAPILRAEQREGYDASLVVVLDPQANYYRTSDATSLPEGDWTVVAVDANGKIQFLTKGAALPQGWRMVHGIGGLPLPPIMRSKR
jgi:hypothetical protein